MSSKESVSIFDDLQEDYGKRDQAPMSLADYLTLCKEDKSAYATAAERLLKAIGEPKLVDTSKDPKLSRLFSNRTLPLYDTFKDFYGMEDTIGQVIGFLKSAAQGLEEGKQILYLLGPVGSAKSSIAERMKELMEQEPFYSLAVKREDGSIEYSPVNENPLGLFDANKRLKSGGTLGEKMQADYGINPRHLKGISSPWAVQKLNEFGGDMTKFKVVKRYPNKLEQIAISKTEPGDENNQDISALVGKVNIRKLEDFDQNTSDAYSYSGGLCTGNRGIMEFVEIFKAPIKVLHQLLTATQEGNYNSTESIGAIPFDGLILAHSNESEWKKFRNNPENEAFISRTCIIRVPYTLRVTEELKIYEKLIAKSELADKPCAPQTLKLMAEWSVLTRLAKPENERASLVSKMKIYDGENMKDRDPNTQSYQDYREAAGLDEGMGGMDTRFAFKTLSQTFNHASTSGNEISADPITLMGVLEERIKKEQLPKDRQDKYIGFIQNYMMPQYREYLGNEIQTAYLESYGEYGQNIFDKYVMYADHWVQNNDFRDPETNILLERADLEAELAKIEKPAGISNPKDFRNEVVNYVLRARANNNGNNPSWSSYEKFKQVIEKTMFKNTDDLLPVISFSAKGDKNAQQRHTDFVKRMGERGYTEQQTRRATEWWIRMQPK